MSIDSRYEFPKDTSAKILTSGLLGEQYIGLSAGGDTAMLKDGDTLKITQSAVVLEKLISQFLFSKAADGSGKQQRYRSSTAQRQQVTRTAIMLQRVMGLVLLGALGALGGCATTGGNPDDPLEGYNRAMFSFNDSVDKAVIKPVATGYKKVMPEVARTGVTNFFSNLGDVWIGVNNVLQGKVGPGVSDFGRFAINTTVGIFGLFDVASDAGLEKHNEDFGQTLGRWGVGTGAYVVLPILGPSDVRDGFSLLVVDWHGDPLWYVANIPTRNELVGHALRRSTRQPARREPAAR